LELNTSDGEASDTNMMHNTLPTASVFSVGDSGETNSDGDEHVAYCFHSVEGYSKVGVYTGNENADGTFVYTGFRPAWILSKEVNESGDSWIIKDTKQNPYNQADNLLFANVNSASSAANNYTDILSNGWKMRSSDSGTNQSGSTYLYIAFAASPFKTANAR
jgi:hypothetical protein